MIAEDVVGFIKLRVSKIVSGIQTANLSLVTSPKEVRNHIINMSKVSLANLFVVLFLLTFRRALSTL
jgi:hypothetical protein